MPRARRSSSRSAVARPGCTLPGQRGVLLGAAGVGRPLDPEYASSGRAFFHPAHLYHIVHTCLRIASSVKSFGTYQAAYAYLCAVEAPSLLPPRRSSILEHVLGAPSALCACPSGIRVPSMSPASYRQGKNLVYTSVSLCDDNDYRTSKEPTTLGRRAAAHPKTPRLNARLNSPPS